MWRCWWTNESDRRKNALLRNVHRGMARCGLWRCRPEDTCLSGYVVGLMPSTLSGPRHVLQCASKFTSKLVKSSLGGDAYAFSEMKDHVALLREFYAPPTDMSPGVIGPDTCGILFARLRNQKTIPGKYPARHFLRTGQPSVENKLSNLH